MDKWSIEEIIESLRQWEDRLYSESETQFLMNKAADYLEQFAKEKQPVSG
jgi:UDP:flavonoid glycosyltransferase YjiC (YdhE family)